METVCCARVMIAIAYYQFEICWQTGVVIKERVVCV